MWEELLSGAFHADSAENMGGLIIDNIPKPRVSAMDNLLTGFNFIVSLNEFTYGFQNVSNIQRHREVGYDMEGGVNDHQIMFGRPNDNVYTLSLRRGYIIHAPDDIISNAAVAAAAHLPNEAARRAALIAINSASPQSALERGPSLGFIQVYSRQKKLVAMFSFLSLGMTEWTLSDLDAQSNDALFESITIAHTGLTMLPATWLPSVVQPIRNLAGMNEDSMATMTAIIEKNKEEFEKRQEKIKLLEKQKKYLDDVRIGFLHERDEILKQRAEKAEDNKQKVDSTKTKEKEALEFMDKHDEITKKRNKDLEDKMNDNKDAKDKEQEALDEKRKEEREKISEQYEARQEAQAEALKEQNEKQEAAKENILKQDEITKQREEAYAEKNAEQKAISDAQKEKDEQAKEQIKDHDEITKQREAAQAEKNADQKAISDAQKAQDEKSKEQIKANEEKAKENQKDEAKNVGERAEAREKAQAEKKEDYNRRMDAQQARTEKQDAQDEENVKKVEQSNKAAEDRMRNEGNE